MNSALYSAVSAIEPLLPTSLSSMDALLGKAHDLSRAATQLTGRVLLPELRQLLRSMNSYYSNKIEGQHTRPLELEQALRKDFSTDLKLAKKQRLAVAHIEAEEAVEKRYVGEQGAQALYTEAAICDLHQELFTRLPPEDLFTEEGDPIAPGQLRQTEVSVGHHDGPTHDSVPAFLLRWGSFYQNTRRGEATLVAMAAAHHRLAWIHPFRDGNGRVARLQTHALLGALGYTAGLWSPLRGFARSTQDYYALLGAADLPRQGDLDGRGNLSERALVDWIDYFLDTCQDQVRFMASLLDVTTMEQRIAAYLAFAAQEPKSGVRMEVLRPLHYLFLTGGELERSHFKTMTGLQERTASAALSALLTRDLLKSDTKLGKVRFALPLEALRFYFPALWPEAEADVAAAAASGTLWPHRQ